jgi:putative DNA primase/helicase
MITSGEAPITSFSEDGGTRARVLEVWGSPFGKADAATAQIVNRVNDGVQDHYGHLGPRFVQYLIVNRQRWPEWREQYRQLRQQFAERAGDNSVAARMATHLAAIGMTARLVHEAVEMPWEYRNVVTELWPELTAETPEADRAAVALRHVVSWAHGHREQFQPAASTAGMTAPSGGWAGRWALEDKDEPYVGFFPHKLDEILEAGGFEPEPVKRLWLDRTWLKVSKGKHQYRTRIGNAMPYVVAIKRTAIEQVEGPVEGEEEGPRGPNPTRVRAAG